MNTRPLRGLLCRLYIPKVWDAVHWSAFLAAVAAHVDGFILDPPYWDPLRRGPFLSPLDLETVTELARMLPTDKPIAIRITGKTPSETASFLQELDNRLKSTDLYPQILWLDTPLAYHSNRGLPHLLERFYLLTSRPFVLENAPEQVRPVKSWRRHVNLRTAIVKTLAENPRFAALIHHGSLRRSLNYAKAVVRRRDFSLLDGDEHKFLEYPNTTGVVSVSANIAPSVWALLVNRKSLSARVQNMETYMKAMTTIQDCLAALQPNPTDALAVMLYKLGYLLERPSTEAVEERKISQFLETLSNPCIPNC